MRQIGKVQHLLEVAPSLISTGPIRFVDHENVCNLHQTSLIGLNGVTPSGIHHDDGGVGFAGNLHLNLAHTHGLHQDPSAANGIK